MKTKIEIFSTEELKNFFKKLNEFFDLRVKSFEELKTTQDKKNLSIVFLDNDKAVSEKTIKKIYKNENFIFVSKDFSVFQKFSLNKKNTLNSPFSINKFIDTINNFINTTKHTFTNIELNNNLVTNTKTNQTIDLTEAENHILLKLFKEKMLKKERLRETLFK